MDVLVESRRGPLRGVAEGGSAAQYRRKHCGEDRDSCPIVEKAFAFEDLEDPIGQIDLAQDRRRRGRIWRRHDGAKRDRRRPRHVRQQPTGERCYRGGGNADRDEYQRRDR